MRWGVYKKKHKKRAAIKCKKEKIKVVRKVQMRVKEGGRKKDKTREN